VIAFAELDCRSNFSFLEGASHPGEMVFQAGVLELAAIGVADRNTLAGVVRAHAEAKKTGMRLLIGCRLQFTDETELIVYPRDRAAYGRLCRLLSIGKAGRELDDGGPAADPDIVAHNDNPAPKADRIAKGDCRLTFEQAAGLGEGMVGLVPAPAAIDSAFETRLKAWRAAWPGVLYLAASPLHRGDDRARINRLAGIASRCGAPMLASNAALYHDPSRRRLQDVLTCIREGCTIDEAGLRLQANAERFLKSEEEMTRLFRGHEDAVARTLDVVEACPFSLDELRYEYPDEPVPPGRTADQHLRRLTIEGARRRFPKGVPAEVAKTIRKELKLIRTVKYANYFLTVNDIVAWAVSQGILCQGRGSAANSVVCYCLGITSVNPVDQHLLIERFISQERQEPPDIDVDFEHERREEVIQYVYRRYGRERAAICATVIHYRPRSAIRDVGKALGLTEDVTGALASTVWGSWGEGIKDDHVDGTGLRRSDSRMQLALELTAELIKFPRHLSQHVGGFILTKDALVETVPVGNGAMADRTFIEWDKDDIDVLGLMKVDVLALGMLTAIRKAFDMIAGCYGPRFDLATVPHERGSVYRMLCRADSLGVFQVESRAQMAMLPRLRPVCFYDLVVEVAIVRPGPIQGDMVHPYLKNREARRRAADRGEPFVIDYPHPHPDHGPRDELQQILDKTMGVPLFQEQAMRIAMTAARFSGAEANGLRRAMATFRHMGTIHTYEEAMVGRMIARGYDPEFANNCFNQIKGFGEYGFPESHAAAFARLVYVSAWIKRVYPEVFAAALLNSQPMGFYAPAQIVRDVREHGVEVRHPDVNESDWDCTLQPQPRRRRRALRLGLRQIDGFRKAWAEEIVRVRTNGGPFASIDDLRTRADLPAAALDLLASADALGSLKLIRREGLWAAKGLPRDHPAPLFAAAGLDEADGRPPAALPVMPRSEEVAQDYQTIRLSLKGHPVAFLRDRLKQAGAVTAAEIETLREGRRITVGGVVLVRQRPGTAQGVVFITLEDETGVVNLVVWPKVFETYRPVVMGARFMVAHGRLQRAPDSEGAVVHLVVERLEDRSADLSLLTHPDEAPKSMLSRGDGATSSAPDRGERPAGWNDDPRSAHRDGHGHARSHPRDVRVLPRSRDFH
jgi:error-prone DNA polymerase